MREGRNRGLRLVAPLTDGADVRALITRIIMSQHSHDSKKLCLTDLHSKSWATKRIRCRNGRLEKDSVVDPYAGELQVWEAEPRLTLLAEHFAGYGPNDCAVLGVPLGGVLAAPLTTKKRKTAGRCPPIAIPRTKECFEFRSGTVVPVLLDHDPEDGRALNFDELHQLLVSLDPALGRLRMLMLPSCSSYVRSKDGTIDSGLRGIHCYLLVPAESVVSFMAWLKVKLFAAGHVWGKVFDGGAVHVRSPVDFAAMGQTNRIAYEAQPIPEDPTLEVYGRDEIRIRGSGAEVLDFAALTPVTEEEKIGAARNEASARKSVAEEAAREKGKAIRRDTDEMLTRDPSIGEERALRQARAKYESRELGPDVIVTIVEGGERRDVTVEQILLSPQEYHEAECLDPIEPSYRGHKVCAIVYADGRVPLIFSQAHGGRSFKLHRRPVTVHYSEGALAEFCEDVARVMADSGVFYRRAGRPVVVFDGRVAPVASHALAHEIDLRVRVVTKVRPRGRPAADGPVALIDKVIPIPLQAVERLSTNPRLLGRLPELRGVRRWPLLLPSGRLIDRSGFDGETGLLFEITGDWAIPAAPTDEDVRRAVAVLMAPLRAYLFSSERDRAACLLALLTAAARMGLDLSPAFLVRASMAGSGKTKMGEVWCLLAGLSRDLIDIGKRGDEAPKRTDTFLMGGVPAALYDNLPTGLELNEPYIATTLTSTRKTIRIFGKNTDGQEVDTCRFICATANTPRILGDAVRRVIPVTIEPASSLPQLHRFEFDPEAVALANRERMIAAAMTVLRAGLGRDPDAVLGSFEVWSRFVGAGLERARAAGCKGFASFTDVIGACAGTDPKADALNALLDAIESLPTGKSSDVDCSLGLTARALQHALCDQFGRRSTTLLPALHPLAEAFDELVEASGSQPVWSQHGVFNPQRCGRMLQSLVGFVFRRESAEWVGVQGGTDRARALVLRPKGP